MPLAPGATFERYAIEALVGRGGMGEVYRALDTRLHRPVALKVLRSDKDPDDASATGGVQRLLREARAAAAFNHPNSVSIYELGEAEGIPYIAMEYVVGSSLRAFVGDRTTSLETKVSWLVDVARALFAAHKAGLVHRDVKPSNIMVSEEGVVKVLDFGLAKPVKTESDPGFQTLQGHVLGTPRYMAPEQLEGRPADARADQFAFGVVAYELLSGVYPGGPLAGAPKPLEQIAPTVTPELSRNVRRMMSRDPSKRFSTMDDAANALRECVPSLRSLKVPPSGDQPRRRTTESDAPTTEHRVEAVPVEQSGAVSIDVPLAKGSSTLPLPAAVGAEISRRVAATAQPSQARAAMTRTLPLAQNAPAISIPPGTSGPPPSPMSFPSGVVSTPQAPTSEPRLSSPTPHGSAATAMKAPGAPASSRRSGAWLIVAALAILVAIAGGAAFALMR